MYKGSFDISQKKELLNNFNDHDLMAIRMLDFSFMPSINIRLTTGEPTTEVQEFMKNLEKLSQYVKIMLNMRKRTIDGSVHHKYLFRRCTREDFTSRGVNVDKAFEEAINLRFCPEVPDDETYY